MELYDISTNMIDIFDISYNISYSSQKLLNIINEITNIKGKYAEFKITNKNIAKDKPLLSLLYFKEGLITDYTFEQYKYRNITENTQMYYFQDACVSYDSNKLFLHLSPGYFLEIHIWDKIFDYPEYDNFNFNITLRENIPRTIYIDFIDYEWINSLIYKKKKIFDTVKNELTNYKNYSIDQINDTIGKGHLIIFNKCPLLQIKKNYELQKYNANDLIQLITKGVNNYEDKTIPNYLQYDLCRWIKEETKNEPSIEKSVFFKFMPFFLETLGNDFKKLYSFGDIPINYTGIHKLNNVDPNNSKKSIFKACISLSKSKINDTDLNMGDLFISSKELEFQDDFFIVNIDFIF